VPEGNVATLRNSWYTAESGAEFFMLSIIGGES